MNRPWDVLLNTPPTYDDRGLRPALDLEGGWAAVDKRTLTARISEFERVEVAKMAFAMRGVLGRGFGVIDTTQNGIAYVRDDIVGKLWDEDPMVATILMSALDVATSEHVAIYVFEGEYIWTMLLDREGQIISVLPGVNAPPVDENQPTR